MAGASLWVGVLGPVALSIGAQAVRLRGGKPRTLLAHLVLRANSDTSVDRLVDALWGESVPASAEDLVRWHVHRLRKLLPDPDRIESRGKAYRLNLAGDETDVGCFERLFVEGRQAACVEAAADRYREALDLWRGPAAYADVIDGTDAELRGEAHRLDELRLVVLEHRTAADLELGRHEAVAAELAGVVPEYPLRETLRVHLMRALSLSGRRVEALEVYRDGRRWLADELGLDPGPELRRMEQAILQSDLAPVFEGVPETVGLAIGPHAEPGVEPGALAGPGPAELPAGPPAFAGRILELRDLAGLFAASSPVVALTGVGGVGKSALAVHLAHQVAERYPDGQLYIDLRGSAAGVRPLAAEDVVRRLLRSIGTPDDTLHGLAVDELAGRLRSTLAGSRMLLVLDDAADAAQVRAVLPSVPECGVLLTSRQVLGSIPNARHHRLEPLSGPEGLRLLTELVGRDRIAADPVAARMVVRLTDGLPLALVTAAARLAARPRWPLAELARRLTDPDRRLDELSDDQGGIRARFAGSYRRLPADASRMFRLLGREGAGVVHVATAARIAGLDRPNAESALDQIVDVQLADSCSGQHYQFSKLVRLYARELAGGQRRANVRPTVHQPLANPWPAPSG